MLRHLIAGLLLASSLMVGCGIGPRVSVAIVSPSEGYVVENGTALYVLVRLADGQNSPVDAADEVTVTLTDPAGKATTTLPCSYRGEGTYASIGHEFPIGSTTGTWRITAVAWTTDGTGEASRSFIVEHSRAERLQAKYGFWLDNFDFFHCHGSDSFIDHEVNNPDAGHVILEEHCVRNIGTDKISVGVFWSRQAFPATAEDARALPQASIQSYWDVQIVGVARTSFQGREAWQSTGTYLAEGVRQHGVLEWLTFQCPGDDRTFTIVTAASQGVQEMLTDELVGLRASFRCP
ncbi:MAG: hypothetical protein KJ734_00160 [Chloroflexi bacterium]|nr:hypothetical protein [Chloroflexota bacterium]